MKVKRIRVRSVCVLALFVLLFSVSTRVVSAQETGTLIVYTETLGGDASFSYSASPSPLSNFQVTIDSGGAARIFNLTAGTYTITQNALPANWTLKEVFLDGTGTGTVNQSQSKATFTITSVADVFYLRFTNEDQTVIPEFPAQTMMLVLVVVTSLVAAVSIKKRRKPAAIAAAFLFSACILVASTGTAIASPDKFIQLGTTGNDVQIQLGTPNRDLIVQFGFGGNDTQYAAGSAGGNVIIQNGGMGDETQTAKGGSENDFIVQEGGIGDNVMNAEGGLGDDNITLNGGLGDDILVASGGEGDDQIRVRGGDGNDKIDVSPHGGIGSSRGIDVVWVDAGAGNDSITYDPWLYPSGAFIDGSLGTDVLTVHARANFTLQTAEGAVLHRQGEGGPVIKVTNFEQIAVISLQNDVLYTYGYSVQATLTLTANAPTTALSNPVILTGALSVPRNGTLLLLWVTPALPNHENGNYEVLNNGVFTRSFSFNQTGTWTFRVFWEGDAIASPAVSNNVTITVTP